MTLVSESVPTISAAQRSRRRTAALRISGTAAAALVLTFVSASISAVHLPWDTLWLWATGALDQATANLVRDFQLPRLVLCWGVGAGLGAAGALLQSVIRNPLASPDVLGVTRGAGVTALCVVLMVPATPITMLPLVALVGGTLVAAVVYGLAHRGGTTPLRLALVGIAAGACCEAVIRFLLMRYPLGVNSSLIWLAGSFFGRTWQTVMITVPWILVCLPLALALARRLDVLGLGDHFAVGLGEPAERTRRTAVAVAVVLASAAVAAAGVVSFVGLIAPHIARRTVGGRLAVMLPMSALVGVLITLTADTVGRGLMPPLEIPAGLVTAVIGAPYFLYLLMRTGR